MTTEKCLLIPTDLSPSAAQACDRAALLASSYQAKPVLIHVANTPPWEALNALKASLHERHGVSSEIRVENGPLIQTLVAHADELAAELLVLGVSDGGALRHSILGSTAERLIGQISCPLLAVKSRPRGPYRSLLLPVDFSPASLAAMVMAKRIAPDAEIILLHAFEVLNESTLRFAGVEEEVIQHYRTEARQEAMQKLMALYETAQYAPWNCRLLVLHGPPGPTIIEQANLNACDLIVMGKQGTSLIVDMMLGSVTRHVVAESGCDVLVCD